MADIWAAGTDKVMSAQDSRIRATACALQSNDLADADRFAIVDAMGDEWDGVLLVLDIERVYLAGISAGLERAAACCAEFAALARQEVDLADDEIAANGATAKAFEIAATAIAALK